jgi:antitoxin component HigA of HigAB toxin-antitoxin module
MPKVKSHYDVAALGREFDELVRLYPPTAIHDKATYDNTMEMIDALLHIPRRSVGQERYLDTLSILVQAYENENEDWDLSQATPLRVLKQLMEADDMNASDLGRLLGDRGLGSRILAGERQLSKAHIRILAERFKVRPDLFL